jgi:hypothetical protein
MNRLPGTRTASIGRLGTIKKAIAAEPDIADPCSAALDVAIAARDHDEPASLLTILADKFGYEWMELTEVAEFAEFVKSDAYAKWAEARKKQKSSAVVNDSSDRRLADDRIRGSRISRDDASWFGSVSMP